MLFEERKWQLDDPVAKYVREFAGLRYTAPKRERQYDSRTRWRSHDDAPEVLSDTGGFSV